MTRLYEGMFLIDNDVVRAGWQQAKKGLCEALTKHGGVVETARRWDERRLAYPIKKKNRATFLLTYFQLPNDAMPALVRDLELGTLVMRHMIVSSEAVSDDERKLAAEEDTGEFVVPEPPADNMVEEPAESSRDKDADEAEELAAALDSGLGAETALAGGSNSGKGD